MVYELLNKYEVSLLKIILVMHLMTWNIVDETLEWRSVLCSFFNDQQEYVLHILLPSDQRGGYVTKTRPEMVPHSLGHSDGSR